jgi:hypothetical protein
MGKCLFSFDENHAFISGAIRGWNSSLPLLYFTNFKDTESLLTPIENVYKYIEDTLT